MVDDSIRDVVTLRDEEGNEKEFRVEALFDMGDKSYALLRNKQDMIVMKVEGDELIGIADQEEQNSILDAYQIAIEGTSSEKN